MSCPLRRHHPIQIPTWNSLPDSSVTRTTSSAEVIFRRVSGTEPKWQRGRNFRQFILESSFLDELRNPTEKCCLDRKSECYGPHLRDVVRRTWQFEGSSWNTGMELVMFRMIMRQIPSPWLHQINIFTSSPVLEEMCKNMWSNMWYYICITCIVNRWEGGSSYFGGPWRQNKMYMSIPVMINTLCKHTQKADCLACRELPIDQIGWCEVCILTR